MAVILLCAGVFLVFKTFKLRKRISDFLERRHVTEYRDPSRLKVLVECRGVNIESHLGRQMLVHRDFRGKLTAMDRVLGRRGIRMVLTSAYRPPGRVLSGVVYDPASNSNHKAGHAIDFNLRYKGEHYNSAMMTRRNMRLLPGPVRQFLLKDLPAMGLRWGGYFSDPVHIDVPLNRGGGAEWRRYNRECDRDFREAGKPAR